MMERWANDVKTTLSEGMSAGTTTMKITSAAGTPAGAGGRIRIDNEIMIVTAGAGTTTQTVTRGAEGTTAAEHANLSTVEWLITAGSLDALEQTQLAEAKYAPQNPNLVAPIYVPGGVVSAAQLPSSKEKLYLMRAIVPKTGTLHDLCVFIVTPSGNVRGGIYDTNDALAGSRTRLYDSGSIVAASGWKSLGDPNISVIRGQQIEFGIMADNTTVTFGRGLAIGTGVNGITQLPTSFGVSPAGALGKFASHLSPGSFSLPTTIAEASALVESPFALAMIARVS